MQLFFCESISKKDNEFAFSREESKHIIKVLRKKEGDEVFITDGKGHAFVGNIVLANPNKCIVTITRIEKQEPRPYQLHLAVAPTKMNDRYEWFLEKATEIGIDEITPIICEHSERKTVKIERFERILQSATKQSLQFHKPKLNPPISFQEFISLKQDGQLFIAHCENSEKTSLKKKLNINSKNTIMIGPEGDFSLNEINTAIASGYTAITLGKTRLRTETAAIIAVHTVSLAHLTE